MGMYLDIYQIRDTNAACPNAEDIKGFDFDVSKWVDDKRFATTHDFDCDYVSCSVFYCCSGLYWRPKDLDKAINWVTKNIEGNRRFKIVEVLTLMKTHKDWYFNYS